MLRIWVSHNHIGENKSDIVIVHSYVSGNSKESQVLSSSKYIVGPLIYGSSVIVADIADGCSVPFLSTCLFTYRCLIHIVEYK